MSSIVPLTVAMLLATSIAVPKSRPFRSPSATLVATNPVVANLVAAVKLSTNLIKPYCSLENPKADKMTSPVDAAPNNQKANNTTSTTSITSNTSITSTASATCTSEKKPVASLSALHDDAPFASFREAWTVKSEVVSTQAEVEAAKAAAEAEVKELLVEAEKKKKYGVSTVTTSYVQTISTNPYVDEADMVTVETTISAPPLPLRSQARARLGRFFRKRK